MKNEKTAIGTWRAENLFDDNQNARTGQISTARTLLTKELKIENEIGNSFCMLRSRSHLNLAEFVLHRTIVG